MEGWHGAHLGTRGDLCALVDIHLDEGGLGEVRCELLVDRLDLLARSTPAEASGEGGRSVSGAHNGAAGVGAARVVVLSGVGGEGGGVDGGSGDGGGADSGGDEMVAAEVQAGGGAQAAHQLAVK